MDTISNATELQDQVVILPGGKDKEGRPVLLITIPAESPPVHVGPSLLYLLSVFSNESRTRGVTVLLDTRKGHWKTARLYIRQVIASLGSGELAQLVVVRPDAFWDKQRVENCTNTQKDDQIVFTSPSRLSKLVEQSQLPSDLGGSYIYNHQQWIENRLKAEEYFKESSAALTSLEEFHQHLLNNRLLRANEVDDALNVNNEMAESLQTITQKNIEKGQELLKKIEHDNRNRKYASEPESMTTPQDTLDTISKIEDISSSLRKKQSEIQEAWKLMQKSFVDTKDINLLVQGIVGVTNWILGPAESLLNAQHKVGHDVSSAEELRNAHEAVELKCWDTYGAYAELLFKIDSFPNVDATSQMQDLIWQKDFMDFVCRSFASRLERRRNVLITSLRFFRLVSEYFDRTGDVFESLVMGKVNDFSTARQKLDKLQINQINLDAMERELVKEGEKLSDMLSMPVKDALGRELALDYSEDIANIRDILDATTARKNLFSDSVELQKLTLEQVAHINSYENDARQAVQWLDELFEVMLQNHGHVGITIYEIQVQKDEHLAFQETAKDTYNYGCQLLNASLVLRQSCKLPIQEHTSLYQTLRHSWQRLLDVSQEQMTRLRVSAVFHRSVEEHCNQLRDLREAVATMPLEEMSKKQTRVRNFYVSREKLLLEVGRMVRLGKLLRSRLKEPIYLNDSLMDGENTTDAEKASEGICDPSVQDNAIAVEAITEKLIEVTNLAEEMDQALRSAQQDCGLLTATSSASTSASTTPTTVISLSTKVALEDPYSSKEDLQPEIKIVKTEELKSDDEFLTASECTPHSRSSSYNTASECEHRYSPWWEYDKKDSRENISKEKMVLGVGLPELPPAKSVLKATPEVPPGKIMREVIETTHLKVQHSHCMGVSSYVLTSEIAQQKDGVCSDDFVQHANPFGNEMDQAVADGDLLSRMKQCGDWLQLKILEVSPELTTLGNTLSEAIELQQAHDEVLRQLQNKQSPVEELLRQADQLISTQKPRAEVYAAMAETLGRAWKDINLHLELRKQILDLHVQYHTKADEFFSTLSSLEVACSDSLVPIDVDAIKQFLNDIHDLRRSLLESLMGALQNGNSLLLKLRELGAEGTLDSRPERIRSSVNRAISQVQGWLDQLHARRQVLEVSFTKRKTQLEQCLALAILASDLREVEDTLKQKREILRNIDQLGDSASSAELLQHEHKKLLPEASQLQERALKITKATEQLVESGCFAGEKATEQAYTILSETSDYVTELEQRSSLLDQVILFFRKAQAALTKLDQLEIQITACELPSTSPKLAQLHEQCARAIHDITAVPIAEGYAILDTAGNIHGTDGVKRMVEELENRKIMLDALCTAHREEKLKINQALNAFLEQQNELYSWLITAAEAFLQGHQDMGSDLPMAKDFWDLHNRLLVDLQKKGNEINALLLTLPPVLEFLEDSQRHDVDQKVEELHQLWLKLKNILETRLDLSAIYVKFHTEADYVNRQIDELEDILNKSSKEIDDETLNKLEEKWESLIPLYQSAKNTGITFINTASGVSEPYLDTKRACLCVESVLEKLSGRQLVVTRNWQSFHTNVVEKREIQMQLELNMSESAKTINWITKLDSQLYPVITTNASNPEEVKSFLEKKLEAVFPEIRRAQHEVEHRIKSVEALITKAVIDESTLNVKNKLMELNQKLVEITTEYQILMQMLITFFNNLADMDNTVNDLNSQFAKAPLPYQVAEIETVIHDQEASKRAILEMFKFAQNDADKLVARIEKQEPRAAADHDISKLQHQILIRRNNWEEVYTKRSTMLITHRQYCQFNHDLGLINESINDVSQQLNEMKGQYGDSLPSAKTTSQAFGNFEKTVHLLDQRINTFANEAKQVAEEDHMNSPHIKLQIAEMQEKWDSLKRQITETRHLIDLSIKYFSIVDEAIEWFKQGSHILVSIARRATAVKRPEEAQALLDEIDNFLKPGEIKQAERIGVITALAKELYQPQITSKSTQVAVDNQDMLESFNSISKELNSLILNLHVAEEERERLRREQEAADALLAAARAEAETARAAAEAAETARRAAEAEARRIAEEEARRRAEAEARRLAEEEARRRAEEEARRRAEEEARKRAEEEARKRAEEEARRRAEEEARRRAEEEMRQRIEEEARKRAVEEALKKAEEEARRRAEEEARRRAEEEARRRAEEELRQRMEEEARKRAVEEALKKAEEEARKRAEEEARRRAEEEARRRAEEEMRLRLEEEARRRAAEEALKRAEEEARRYAEQEARLRAEEEARKRAEEEARRLREEFLRKSVEVFEVDKPLKIISNNVDVPIQKADVSSKESINQISKTVEIVKVTHLEHGIPQQGSKSEVRIVEISPPIFILPLLDTVLQEGSKFTFICQVKGNPTPTVSWFKDGMPIDNNPDYQTTFEDGTCTLTIEETFAEDSARYTCKAANSAGTVETTANLSVKEVKPQEELIPPTFVKYLEPAIVKQGQKFQLECKVEGHPLPTVQWFKNSECIDNCPDYSITYNNGEAILRFEEVTLEDIANFTCKASNQVGTAQTTANLCVEPCEKNEKPFFVIPLSNVMARAGQKIKLECEVSGLPVPSLSWSHDGKPVKETRELKLQTDDKRSTLVISEAFPNDAGTYSVTAKNEVGEAISECNITVKGRLPTETSDSEIASDMEPIKPSIQVPLKDVSVFDGKTVRLDCVIVGQPEPEVIWYHDDKPVKESADFQLLFQGDRCSLVIQEAYAEDAGEYKVVALNSAGEASSKCKLTVTPLNAAAESVTKEIGVTTPSGFPPKFNKLLSDVLACEGDHIALEAVVEAEPSPQIKWLLNNRDLEPSDHLKVSHDEKGNVKLEIDKVLPEDKGVYTVKATNAHGEAKCFAQLIVKSSKPLEVQKEYEEIKSPPTFKETFTDRQAFEETAVKFECIVTGKPTPRVKWLFNDEAVSGKDFLISTSGDRQVLSIPNVSKSNTGKITCIAENDVGKATCTARLSVVAGDNAIAAPKSATDLQHVTDSSYSSKKEVYMQSSTTSTSTVITNSGAGEPDVQTRGYIAKDSQSFKQVNQEPPQVHESHMVEEFRKVGKEPGVIQEHFTSTVTMGDESKAKQISVTKVETQPRVIKSRPPKFTSPIVGKIVDQGVDVVLEGILDGYPTPTVKWEKNGVPISNSDKITVSYELNKVRVEVKNVTTSDGGRYTCTAVNDAGSATSTSDLVVRKTVFPPVFGRRLQAQVVKKGDRVHLEIEVTGTPTPTVTWFKDDRPLKEVLPSGYKILVHGNSHTLVIEKVDFAHTGKYMAKAVNEGGEAQSIADFAVFEPTPDTMVEVVKTVVFEDVHKHETLAKAAEQSKTTFTAPQVQSIPISVSKPEPVSLVSYKSTPKSYIESSEKLLESQSTSQAEFSTTTETTVSKESKTYRIESNTAGFSPEIFREPLKRETPIIVEKPIEIPMTTSMEQESTGIETSSITKQSSLDYFVQKLKQNEEPVVVKELPKGTPLQPEIYTKFEDARQTEVPSFLTKQTEEKLHHESMLSQQSYISESFNLIPEPPPEICYTPKQETYHDVSRIYKHTQQETRLPAPSYQIRSVSPKPSAEALEMEKLWTPHKEPERPIITSPLPTRTTGEPSAEGLAMEKAWAHKSEIHRDHVWPPSHQTEESKSWSTQTTLEKKWAPVQTRSETIHKETHIVSEPVQQPIHYVAKVTDLHEKGYDHTSSTMESTEIQENIIYEHSAKPSEIVKTWPPPSRVEDVKPTYKPVMPSIHSLSIRPASVQDITDEVYLEPGPPPEMDYAPPPCEIKTVPPPLPPKQERPQAPPVPARPFRPAETKKVEEHQPFRRVPKLQPVPFQTEEVKPRPIKTGPPPTPSKFIKGRFTDSDYESDYEASKIPVKWKPYTSDTEEPSYRHVKAPKFSTASRSKSVEPTPLPTYVHQPFKAPPPTFVEPKRPISPPLLKPGTPPEYFETDTKYKTESKQVIDGYMADTDEPLTLRKRISKFESKQHEMKSEYYSSTSESSRQKFSYESQSTKSATPKVFRKTTTAVPAPKKELVATPIITSMSTTKNKVIHREDRDSSLESFPYKPDAAKPKHPKGPPPPSPSKFVKGEFRESDYESDYEGRISSVWRSDLEPCYKPVRPVLTPSGRQSDTSRRTPTPPTEFDHPPHFTGPPRPKFEPIEKLAASKLSESLSQKSTVSQVVHKPKPVTPRVVNDVRIQPGSPPEIAYAPGPKTTQYYRSTTSAPYQNAVQTETSNVMHFKESTEHCHRTMSLEQTRKVITFGQDQKDQITKQRGPPPATPTKFVKGEFRESDYESEVENAKIKSVWLPGERDGGEPRYRKVRAPQTPTHFESGKHERVFSPMEFEMPPSVTEIKVHDTKESSKSISGIRKQFEDTVDNNKIVKYNHVGLKPGSPPQYSYSPATVTKIASKNMENMSHTFKSKAQQFVHDIVTDVNKKSSEKITDSPQVYREETRSSQHGTKHVDPDTGLIYFKYDFGYEFGIILPGQGKGGEIPTPQKTIIEPPKRTRDIEMPVYHESTQPKHNSTPTFRPVKITNPSKNVKWEPTSESEMSEYEDGKKKYLSSPRWEQSSTSPISISPSLPSTSPAFNAAAYRGTDSRSSAPTTPVNRDQNYVQPKRPPLFITPLRDIAVVSGQAARFECIVQSESTPSVLWSKNGRIIEHSQDLSIYYRNGVCRLTIPQAYPEDAGTYTCTASNQIGAVGTTATLQVPGERRSQYIK